MYKYQDKEMSGNGQDNQLSDFSFFLPLTSQSKDTNHYSSVVDPQIFGVKD